MRIGKELIGKPIFSVTDGRQMGTVKDLYLDPEMDMINGIYLGQEGFISRRSRVIPRQSIAVLGVDAVLVTGSDVATDSDELPEVAAWLRRSDVQGRDIDTSGGTKVGTVGDVLIDEEAKVVGFALARAYVEGPVADNRMVMKEAVLDTGGVDGIITVDLAKAERPSVEPAEDTEPAKSAESTEPADPAEAEEPAEDAE